MESLYDAVFLNIANIGLVYQCLLNLLIVYTVIFMNETNALFFVFWQI